MSKKQTKYIDCPKCGKTLICLAYSSNTVNEAYYWCDRCDAEIVVSDIAADTKEEFVHPERHIGEALGRLRGELLMQDYSKDECLEVITTMFKTGLIQIRADGRVTYGTHVQM